MSKQQPDPNYEGMATALLADAKDSLEYYEMCNTTGRILTRPHGCMSRLDAERVMRYARIHRLIDEGEEEFNRGVRR